MRAILRAVRREAALLLGDPGALLVLVGAIVLYAFFYPIPYLPEVLKDVPIAVVDLDHSRLSRQLVRMADAHELLAVTRHVTDLHAAEQLIKGGTIGGILVIPANFERDVLRAERVTVAVFTDASYFLVYRQALTGLLESTGTLSAGIEIRRFQAQGMSESQARAARDPLPLLTRPLFNPAEGYASYIVPSVLVLLLQQTLLIGLGMLGGTASGKPDLAAAPPARPAAALTTLIGRSLFYFGLYAIHAVFYFGIVVRVFGFPSHARAGTTALFAGPFLLAVVFLGLAVSNLFTSREAAIATLFFTSLPALFVAGFSWPPEAIPGWIRHLALLLPSTPGIAGFLRVNQMGASIAEVRTEWMTLWVLAAAYFLLAWATQARRPGTAGEPRRPAGDECQRSLRPDITSWRTRPALPARAPAQTLVRRHRS